MTNEIKTEENTATESQASRRPYEPPTIRDFLQPLVVLGTNAGTTSDCATPKPPKHP